MERKTYHIQIPEKVTALLSLWNETPPFKGFNYDDCRLLLSIISTHQRKDDNGEIYCRLKMQYLKKVVFKSLQYILFLTGENIIMRFGGYKQNEYAWSYRFTDEYQSPYILSELENPKLERKISKLNTNRGREECRLYPLQKKQLKTLTIDLDKAVRLAKQEYPEDIVRYNFAVGQATRIQNKEPYFIRDESGHRVHTPLTNLVSFLRSEVQIGGKYLSGLDISNSQMYFAVKILLDPESLRPFFPGQLYYMMLKCLRLPEQKDVAEFVLLVSQARFYKFLEEEFIKEGLEFEVIDPEKASDECKTQIFTVVFEKNELTSRAKKIFQKHFPNVDKAFSVLRMVNHADLVNCLSRMESYAINDLIIGRLNKEHPEMIGQQIYDNLVTSIVTDDIVTAGKIMTEELTSFVGSIPILKTQNFRHKNKIEGEGRRRRKKEGEKEYPYHAENSVIN